MTEPQNSPVPYKSLEPAAASGWPSAGIIPDACSPGDFAMSYVTAKDGTEIYYKDWGTGPVIFFSHGWPLSADMWEQQMMYFASNGYRVIAHDRRGFGRSSQPWTGYDYDTFADDIALILDTLDVTDVTMVGFSMGGGDVARYISRYKGARVAKACLTSAVTPYFIRPMTIPPAPTRVCSTGSAMA